MAKKKVKAKAEDVSVAVSVDPTVNKEGRTAAEQAIYDQAFDDISKSLGTNKTQLDKIAASKVKPVKNVEYEIPFECKINGKVYSRKGIESADVVDVLVSMAGAKRMRLIREKVSHKYEVEMLASGSIKSSLIGAEDEIGTKVSSV